MSDAWKTAPLPEPVYGCANRGCAEEVSWPAAELWWFGGEHEECSGPGWYCDNCLSMLPHGMVDRHGGPSLARALECKAVREAGS